MNHTDSLKAIEALLTQEYWVGHKPFTEVWGKVLALTAAQSAPQDERKAPEPPAHYTVEESMAWKNGWLDCAALSPAPQEKNEWHEAVLVECMKVESCYVKDDPAKTLANLIDWHVKAADDLQPAQQERQEPVATVDSFVNGSYSRKYQLTWHCDVPEGTRLYAAPPQAEAKPEQEPK